MRVLNGLVCVLVAAAVAGCDGGGGSSGGSSSASDSTSSDAGGAGADASAADTAKGGDAATTDTAAGSDAATAGDSATTGEASTGSDAAGGADTATAGGDWKTAQPAMNAKCALCHGKGGKNIFDATDCASSAAKASAIKQQITAGKMPQTGAPALGDGEKKAILDWAEAGGKCP